MHSGSRAWIPDRFPYIFSINKGANQLSAAIILERHDKARLLIMLGSSSGFNVAFDTKDFRDTKAGNDVRYFFDDFKEDFIPKAMGTYVKLDSHRVRVTAEPRVIAAVKYYLVDIQVEAIPGSYIPLIDPIIHTLSDDMKEDANRTKTIAIKKIRKVFRKENDS
jgi:hypothetical protein